MAKRTKKDEAEDVAVGEDWLVEPKPEMEPPVEPEAVLVVTADPVVQADEVTTVLDEVVTAPADDTQQPESDLSPLVHARDLVTVKFIGPGRAVLGNDLILHGETRANVSRATLARAEQIHPGEFEIVG